MELVRASADYEVGDRVRVIGDEARLGDLLDYKDLEGIITDVLH
jgi:hypothetical protein